MIVKSEKTSHAGLERQFVVAAAIDWDQTGWELGDPYQVVIRGFAEQVYEASLAEAALLVPMVPLRSAAADLGAQAAALARETPQVASVALPPPRLSGNLAKDVHLVCGLTWAQIAGAFGVSERAAAGWQAQGVPRHREDLMEALRAIGVILVAGLGPDGVSRWLTSSERPRLDRLRDGEVEAVVGEASSYLDAPAT